MRFWIGMLMSLTGLGIPLTAQETGQVSAPQVATPVQDGILLTSSDSGSGSWQVVKQTLRGGIQEGVEIIQVDNGRLEFTVIPTRGMSVHRAECDGLELAWNSPVKQIVHPRHVDLNDHGGLGWLTGFNELMVRCGVSFAGHPGEDNGQMLTLHGRIGNIPARDVEVSVDEQPPHRIRVRGRVDERMFKFGQFELWTEVSTVPGSNSLEFKDRLVNRSEYEQEYQIIYHTNFGRPLLEQGARFVAPVKTLAPFDEYAAKDLDDYHVYLGPTRDYGEQVYCATMFADRDGFASVMLHNAKGDRGVAMRYAVDTLPYFTLWKNTDTESDGYVTGLEPGSGFPYNRSVERVAGRVGKLAPGGEVTFQVSIAALTDADAVARIAERIKAAQGDRATDVRRFPPRDR